MSLQRVALPALAVVAVVAVVFGATSGPAAAWSALGGGLAVVVLLASTPMILGPIALVMPGFSLAAAVTFYLTKISVLAAALVGLSSPQARDGVDATALGLAVIATTLAWTALLVVAEIRARQPIYDLPDDRS
ncbi:hypothetical protein [Aeromicrobium sp. CF3.5]|uniref:hypothetical protein n=1 Tax=Aeromicrobium sp. CF3.5 TaxID=3373078 RepID=UPI003EE788AB